MPKATKTTKTTKTITQAKEDISEVVKSSAEQLLHNLEIPAAVTVELSEDGIYQVVVHTDESGLLIGYHGETLSSFQMILGLLVFRQSGEWARLLVEVGDYRARRQEQLQAMAEGYARQALSTGQPVYLPFLPPVERRIIHLALEARSDVMTESEGEGRQRRVVVKPKVQPV